MAVLEIVIVVLHGWSNRRHVGLLYAFMRVRHAFMYNIVRPLGAAISEGRRLRYRYRDIA